VLLAYATRPEKEISVKSLLALILLFASSAACQNRILVYTRSYTADGKGYVHENIAASVAALQGIAAKNHLGVDVSDDPAVFTTENLRRYGVLVFRTATTKPLRPTHNAKRSNNTSSTGVDGSASIPPPVLSVTGTGLRRW
jgi:hypothetical protein